MTRRKRMFTPIAWFIGVMVILAVIWVWSARKWLERGVRAAADVHHLDVGIELCAKGKLAEAVEQFREAIRIKPEYAEAYSKLGLALERQGKVEEAVVAYREAIRSKPDLADSHVQLGHALLSKDVSSMEALEELRIGRELQPNLCALSLDAFSMIEDEQRCRRAS